jgi:hypothetical protein
MKEDRTGQLAAGSERQEKPILYLAIVAVAGTPQWVSY